ncbi:MAG: DsbE family thiol:disulfide interchange protein [Burkholderiales bacterium]|jgi:cytochrome c biogenesis protein CcmG/thiol:disulfide interchange protein DsbE|nr:DsbE family thiol:disulfide interchange protein [Burkholderiales bacterium]
MKKVFIPLIFFFALVIFLAIGLNRDPREIPSPLIGKPAPAFTSVTLESDKTFSPQQMLGKVWLLNVWATWCVACRQEHPVLVAFSEKNNIPIIGLSYKEIQPQDPAYKQSDATKLQLARERSAIWLQRYGNPYATSVMDLDGRVGIQYGVYGVPETYVIDQQGVIRFKHVGAVTPQLLADKILPLIQGLGNS